MNERTNWLRTQDARLQNALRYYLGPTGIPDKLNALAQMAQFSDAGDMVEAADASRNLWNDPSLQNAARYATAGTAMALPLVSARMMNQGVDVVGDALRSGSDDVRRFGTDESGAIKAYHGSPHDFDRFSLDKIGTGEGAQAYGHGLYFAESPGVAKSYQEALANPVAAAGGNYSPTGFMDTTAWAMNNQGKTLEEFSSAVTDAEPWRTADEIQAAWNKAQAGYGRLYEVNIDANPEDFLDWDAPLSEQPGVLNRLGMSARPENEIHDEAYRLMMDGNDREPGKMWFDHPDLKARVDELQDELDRRAPNMTGQEFYRGGADGDVSNILSQMGYGNPDGQSASLRERGIPGIRYLDQGSRGYRVQGFYDGKPANAEQSYPTKAAAERVAQQYRDSGLEAKVIDGGTRNYVLFDDSLVSILKKYGLAGMAMGGAAAYDATTGEAMAAPPPRID